MRLETYRSWNQREKKPPLRTVSELAEELGVKEAQLRFQLANDESAPKCVLNHQHGAKVHSNRWFDRAAVLRWWKDPTRRTIKVGEVRGA